MLVALASAYPGLGDLTPTAYVYGTFLTAYHNRDKSWPEVAPEWVSPGIAPPGYFRASLRDGDQD